MGKPVPQLRTPRVIAEDVKAPLSRVLNVLSTRPHIRPVACAGNVRLYDVSAVAQVRHELNAIDARRCRRVEVACG